ncbi:MAG: diguanylate cyclase [Anaerolineaceae bacterium]|nr:diguanylate cyclase [Anaerolineaceae bacterium]
MCADTIDRPKDEAIHILLDVLKKGTPAAVSGELSANPEYQELMAHLTELRQFLLALSNGDLSQELLLKGPIAGSLKNLQANLRHLTWQTQKIAEGDFSQRVDFLGDFSAAFNQMAIKLEEARKNQIEIDRAIRESEARYRALVDFLPDGVLVHQNGFVVFANMAFALLMGGKHPEDVCGKKMIDLVHPVSRAGAKSRMKRTLTKGETIKGIEEKFIQLDGNIIDVEIAAMPFMYDGSPAVQNVIRDITARKRDQAALDEQVRFEKMLSGLSATLVRSDPSEVEEVIGGGLQQISEFLNVDRAILFAYLPGWSEFRIVSEYSRQGMKPRVVMLESSVIPWLFDKFNRGEIVVYEDVRMLPPEAAQDREKLLAAGVQSFMTIPIAFGGNVMGGITIVSHQNRHVWSHEIVVRIQLIAEIFISAMARSRAERAEHEQRTQAEVLRDSAAAFNRTMNVDQVFDCILDFINRVIPHDAVNIMLVNDQDLPIIVRAKGYKDRNGTGVLKTLPVAEMPFLKHMTDTAGVVIVSDTASDPRWVKIERKTWVRSYAAMPLVVRGEVKGFINLDSAKSGSFTNDHLTRLRAFADQAAIAYSNALLVEEMHQANRSLQNRLTEIQKLQDELREQAIRDPLTGLFNRRYLEETLNREIANANREFAPVSIIVMDLDNFKLVNDTYGHQAGDLMLQALGQLLKASTRVGDIACRYGGEEFIIVMPGASAAIAAQRAENIRATFDALTVKDGNRVMHATLSLGVATYPINGATGEDVLIRADRALYQAKRNGRNRVVSYSGTAPLGRPGGESSTA